MKTKINFITTIVLTIMILSAFAACNKDEIVSENNHIRNNNAEGIIVAKTPITKDGTNDLELTFDKKKFIHTFDSILNSNSDINYATENVSAYIQYEEEGYSTPYLSVSVLNLNDESSETLFMVLEEVPCKLVGPTYKTTTKPGIICHTNEVERCRRNPDYPNGTDVGACTAKERISDGFLLCKPCWNGVACQQTNDNNLQNGTSQAIRMSM